MSAKTDLENAFSILDAGITSHVSALKASKAATAIAQEAANDETYLKTLTSKVLSWADQLAASNPQAAPAVAPSVAPVAAPAVAVAPAPLPTPVVAPVSAPVHVAPVAVPHQPSVLETMKQTVEAMLHNQPK